MSKLTTNTASLQAILDTVNALPEQTSAELQEKTVTPKTSAQTVSPDSGYDGLSKVTVNAMPTATQATPSITVSSAGLITAKATQTAGYVAAGTKSATKQLTTQAAQTITPGTANKTIASGRYLTGTQTIKGDANLVPANIAEGVSIFGVTGTHAGGGGGAAVETCTATINFIATNGWESLYMYEYTTLRDGVIVHELVDTMSKTYMGGSMSVTIENIVCNSLICINHDVSDGPDITTDGDMYLSMISSRGNTVCCVETAAGGTITITA